MNCFPDPESRYHVCASYPLRGGQTFTAFIEGPFEFPDQAQQARDRIRAESGLSVVHCVEVLGVADAE